MRQRTWISFVAVLLTAACTLKDPTGRNAPAPPDVAAPPEDAIRTASGLASKVLQIGFSNMRPTSRSTVKVTYTGWTTDGQKFDSGTHEFPLDQVIKGWTEGIQLMVVGEKRRFWIPGSLAYDYPGARPDAPKGMLVFDIELLSVK